MSTYEISKSSLLSLKAEILKKQDELKKAKLENRTAKLKTIKKGPLDLKNKGIESRQADDITEEEQDLLKKSRSALEAKTKLYDKLCKKGSTDEETKHRYLVHFNKKSNVEKNFIERSDDEEDKYPESEEEYHNDDDYKADNSDDEWVEYVDCLGRTRTCLKKDLSLIKEKDNNLRDEVQPREQEIEVQSIHEESEDEPNDVDSDESNEMLSSDMRRELQRKRWEKEEAEIQKKTNVHYQDILFSEARTHGVGYYGFSKDEEERAKEQEALKKLRQETHDQQKLAQEIKKNREKQLSARILAAKNRKRARMGLPALTSDDEQEKQPEVEVVEEVKVEKSKEEIASEKRKEIKRKMHVRPWDVGKDGAKDHYKYTQEEWVSIQRKKRENEFAPPRAYNSTAKVVDLTPESNKSLYFSSKKTDDFHVDSSRPPPNIKRKINPYLDSKKQSMKTHAPIVDECSDDELMKDYQSMEKLKKGVEIAPPPTYEYYGPSGSKKSKPPKSNNMEDSIMQGLKYLRDKVEKKSKN